MTKEDRTFWLKLKICPRCRKERLWGDETVCLSCKEKRASYNRKYYQKNKGRWNNSIYQQKRRELLKSQGLCIYCGKYKTVSGNVTCFECKEKHREYRARA